MQTIFAPFRVSLFGGGADFPDFYKSHTFEGLGFSIDQGAIITFNPNCFYDHKFRLVYSKVETIDHVQNISHPLIKAIFTLFNLEKGELHYTSDFPSRSGLGTSSAFAVGLLKLLLNSYDSALLAKLDLQEFSGKIETSSDELSSLAIFLERIMLGEIGGVQDQILCSNAGLTKIKYGPSGWKSLPINNLTSRQFIEEHCCLLELANSGALRDGKTSSDIQRDNLSSGARLDTYRKYVKEMSRNGIDATLCHNLTEFAGAIDKISEKKNSLLGSDPDGETTKLQRLLKSHGVLASRIIGAGNGGFLLIVGSSECIRYLKNTRRFGKIFPINISNIGPTILRRT